jgi:hypothetical protein
LFKKGSVGNPQQYKGIHLTAVISKVAERVIAKVLAGYLEETGSFGESQWAFQTGKSCRDLVALLAMKWVLGLHGGQKTGVYFSDVSGAFDRVSTEILLGKLAAAGVDDEMVAFLASYLKARRCTILVDGSKSQQFPLEDTVFQGVVLGPKLWNLFFQDVTEAIPDECSDYKFADDLTCDKVFSSETTNEQIREERTVCQQAIHQWGVQNRIAFDPGKEDFAVIHATEGEGKDFRLLGTWWDTGLRMETNVRRIVAKARPKVDAILRSRRFYSTKDLVRQYKTHVLC